MTITITIAIAGARGRMGREAILAMENVADIKVVAALDYKFEGHFLHGTEVKEEAGGIPIYTSFEKMINDCQPDVLLDLTDPDAVYGTVQSAILNGVRPVVGTSGLSFDQIEKLMELSKEHQVGGIIAPNFSIGAVLMMKFSAMAARYLGDIEIIEMHHNQKVDAPSGTGMKTAEMIKQYREPHHQGHPEEKEHEKGARGADFDGMKIHSVRLPGLLAHQEVLLGGEGELLTIRHDSFNRSCFMPGIQMAIRSVMKKDELLYGLENILD